LEQAAAISRAAQAGPEASAYRRHLGEIIGSPAFKGSRRSQEFLQHVVEMALTGHFDELKERALGVGLFGRPASYNTSEDGIVRVTASDVRRRLHQFYADVGTKSDVSLDLPAGSYIPEFQHRAKGPSPVPVHPPALEAKRRPGPGRTRTYMFAAFAAGVACTALIGWLFYQPSLRARETQLIQPWSSMFLSDLQTHIVYCDPDVSRAQGLFDFHISLSEYANHRYVPDSVPTEPAAQKEIHSMRGVNVASIDAALALSVAELASKNGHHIKTHTARSLQLIDFKSEDNFLILGSPRSNPWFALFDDELDFRFEYDSALKQEVIRNANPKAGEAQRYVPTAQGWDTGHAYAVIAFVSNPGQKGRALLVAGSNAEATEAAGKLITNLELMSKELARHGIDPHGAPQSFEILLRVSAMAGTSNASDVIAWHKLRN
jgi:hypothetical protein